MRKYGLLHLAALLMSLLLITLPLCPLSASSIKEDAFLDSGDVSARIGFGNVEIHVTNSVTSQGLAGVEFQLSSLLGFTGQVYTATTDSTGTCTFSSLSLGVWYLREKTSLTGYIPYLEILPVSIGLGTLKLELKITPYGSIEVQKVDENDLAVQGATFSLYSGINTSSTPIKTGLTSDADGKLTLSDITPGTYTLLETAAPSGYHLNTMPHTFEVLAGNKRTVKVVNNTVKRGAIHLYMRDAATNEQLADAVFGIYRDPAFLDKLEQITSLKDAPAVVGNLLPGTYYVKELAVPEGYLIDAPAQTIVLSEGQEQAVTFLNSRNYPTAGNYALPLICGLSGLTICGILALFMRKHK